MTIANAEDEAKSLNLVIQETSRQVDALLVDLNNAKRRLSHLKSVEFVRVNNITRKDVAHSGIDAAPYCLHIDKFAEYLASLPQPPLWCEWNTQILYTSDVIAGRFVPTVARWKDVPE